jgi:hypothetical protein
MTFETDQWCKRMTSKFVGMCSQYTVVQRYLSPPNGQGSTTDMALVWPPQGENMVNLPRDLP